MGGFVCVMMVVRFESLVAGHWIPSVDSYDGERTGEMKFVKHVMEGGPVTSNAARVRYGSLRGFGILLLFPRSAPVARTILTSRKQSTHPSMASAWPNRQTISYMTYPTRGERERS